MYLLRKEIEDMLHSNEAVNYDILSKKLYEMIFLFELDSKDDLSLDIFANFKDGITTMIQLIKNESSSDTNLKVTLSDMFKFIWKLLASYNLYKTYEGDLGYDKNVIKAQISERTKIYLADFKDQMSITQ